MHPSDIRYIPLGSVWHSPLIGFTRFCWTTRTPSANSFDRTNMHNAQIVVALEFHWTAILIRVLFVFIFFRFVLFVCGPNTHSPKRHWACCHSAPKSVCLSLEMEWRKINRRAYSTCLHEDANRCRIELNNFDKMHWPQLRWIECRRNGSNRSHFIHSQRLKLNWMLSAEIRNDVIIHRPHRPMKWKQTKI